MALAMIYPEAEKGGRGKKREAGNLQETYKFSRERLSSARQVLRYSEEYAQAVLAGAMSLDEALLRVRQAENRVQSVQDEVQSEAQREAAARKVHPLADIFPAMDAGEFQSLVDDINDNGLREPIWLYDGRILDGRHRYRACRTLGIAPETRVYEGGDPAAFVISLNLKRRHLSESQRAMIAARLANLGEGRPSKTAEISAVSQGQAAEMLNVSRDTVRHAKSVQTRGIPELQRAVEQGEVAVSAAAKVAALPEEEQVKIFPPDMPVEERREAVAAFVSGKGKEPSSSRKNPYYVEPHPYRRKSYDLIGACEEITEHCKIEVLKSEHLTEFDKEELLPLLRQARDVLNTVLELYDAKQASGGRKGRNMGGKGTRGGKSVKDSQHDRKGDLPANIRGSGDRGGAGEPDERPDRRNKGRPKKSPVAEGAN